MMARGHSAARYGFYSCEVCGLVSHCGELSAIPLCPRCHARLSLRKERSLSRTWALVIASYILYIPANLLTMMETGSLFSYRKDTIISGVIYLWGIGAWFVATVVFIASVTIPLLKLVSLTALLISVQRRSVRRLRERTRLYRLLEFVGRWSMLDIYVVTLLAALVQFQPMTVVKAGPAALAFGAVVILTMFATLSFDPRLIWDPVQDQEEFELDE
ncbi:paraquat-inducible protein A [Geomonas sp. RF6]|uniref:paraquat-inducible protein A n=1 Tax=Geomonas sp. RF6 TaxID=2897342 RepID=UPI001E61EA45|nr:paraquat-inducible protein A [Geomonas sp. RF6]UFS70804.1 paraquat-inducible protein A [Geomonas sp. RF6]